MTTRRFPSQLQYERYFPGVDHCCRSPTPSGVSSPVGRSSASRKKSSGEPVIRSDGSTTIRSIARVRPFGDQATPITSAIGGRATRSVQTYASGPLGGVGDDGRRGGSVGDGDGDAVRSGGRVTAASHAAATSARAKAIGPIRPSGDIRSIDAPGVPKTRLDSHRRRPYKTE